MRAALRVGMLALPLAAGWGLSCVLTVAGAGAALAQATNFRQELDDIKQSIPGFGVDHPPIDFTERAPLVVPPTNDLPPPVDSSARLSLTDPDATDRIKAMSDPRRPVPADDPGAAAAGANSRAFLIEPPSGMRNPDSVANEAAADGFKDAPKRKKGTQTAKVRHVRRTPAVASQ